MKKLLRNIILVNCVLISVCSLVGVMVCIVFGIGCLIFDEDMKRYLIGLAICIPVASITCGMAGYLSDSMNEEEDKNEPKNSKQETTEEDVCIIFNAGGFDEDFD